MKTLYGLPAEVRFCTRCVISNQRPNSAIEYQHRADSVKPTIAFDADGVCDACRVAERKKAIDWTERERELRDLLDQHRSRNGAYDCIVPGSGGKDSFFAAHTLRYKYGMHPLLVTWAPHIYTSWGWRNFQRWATVADNYLITPNVRAHRLLTRLAVENLLHPFQPFVIGQKATPPKFSLERGIRLVIYGENEAEYGNPKADADRATRSAAYHSGVDGLHLGGVSVEELRGRYGFEDCDLQPYLPAHPDAIQSVGVDVRYLGYYLPWHPQSCYYYAVENGGFEAAPERTPGTYSKYNSIDDMVDDLHYWTTWIKFGIGRATYDAAQEIRSGDITREEGVALVHRFDGEWPARFEQQLMDYLSVSGFPRMTKELFLETAERFKSPHLWDGAKLRHVVA